MNIGDKRAHAYLFGTIPCFGHWPGFFTVFCVILNLPQITVLFAPGRFFSIDEKNGDQLFPRLPMINTSTMHRSPPADPPF